MQQRMIDCWIEAAEAREVCQWALAEQLPAHPTAALRPAPSLMARLRHLLMLEMAQLRLAFIGSTRSAA